MNSKDTTPPEIGSDDRQPRTGATGPLAHVRILDLSSVIMGPMATQILADLGADVITVEGAGGDTNRVMGAGPHPQFSGIALNLLRNKRNICLDLRKDDDRTALLRIAEDCDALITNLRPGSLARLGLTYDDLIAVNPSIIYCQAQGFALDSERGDDPAYDDIIQAASGIADVMGRSTGQPTLVPTIVADKVCALTIVYSVLAALTERDRSGQGQHIEVPMVDVMRSFTLVEHGAGAISARTSVSPGYGRILTPHRRPGRTRDGWIHILPYTREHYNAMYAAGGRDDLVDDPRSATKRDTITNADFLYSVIHAITPQRTTSEWLEFCRLNNIPATEVVSLEQLIEQLPLAEHPTVGPYRVIPSPVRFSRTPANVYRPAPMIGEHTQEVLAQFDALSIHPCVQTKS